MGLGTSRVPQARHSAWSLVREGVFEVKVTLEGTDEPLTEGQSANKHEKDLQKLKERLER